jgi:hypothetical protein
MATDDTFGGLCSDLGLSIRTQTILGSAGIASRDGILSADMWQLHAAGAGKVALEEVWRAQRAMAGQPDHLVSRDQIAAETTAPEVTAEQIGELAPLLETAGWQRGADDRWRFFNRDDSTVVHLTLVCGQRAVWLQVAQRDQGLNVVCAAKNGVPDLVSGLIARTSKLTYLGVAEVIRALAPQMSCAWIETRGGFIPAS